MAPIYGFSDKTHQLLPNAQRVSKVQRFSKLAQKYSHPSNSDCPRTVLSHSPIAGTFKSGLTPLPLSATGWTQDQRLIHNYQKRRLVGFSSSDMEKLGALAAIPNERFGDDSSLEAVTAVMRVDDGAMSWLDNPIHPMYDRERWVKLSEMPLHSAPIPVRGDAEGYWLAENPHVWDILVPCLRLASQMLQHAHMVGWWDGLLNLNLKRITTLGRIPVDRRNLPLYTFHPRPGFTPLDPANRKEFHEKLAKIVPKIKIRLISGYAANEPGVVDEEVCLYGICGNNLLPNTGTIFINVSSELLQVLSTGHLNSDEKRLARFEFANTLMHETAHAVWYALRDDFQKTKKSKKPTHGEPYFETEPLQELGFSLENNMWGGDPKSLSSFGVNAAGGPGLPSLGICKSSWFRECNSGYDNNDNIPLDPPAPVPGQPDLYYISDYYPIPTTWFIDLQKKDKWEYIVRKVGISATQMGPTTYGMRNKTKIKDPRNLLQISTPLTQLQGLYVLGMQRADMTSLEIAALEQEVSRVEKAIKILNTASITFLAMYPDNVPVRATTAPAIDRSLTRERYPCVSKRYEEIRQYCLNNRKPLQLAFDSMDFDIPEPTMYRYILNQGGITISPTEFRDFLHCCQSKRRLFEYQPFPGPGMITKVPNGWPIETPYTIPSQRLAIDGQYFDDVLETFEKEGFRTSLYRIFGEFRDVDIEWLRKFLGFWFPGRILDSAGFRDIINDLAIDNTDILTLGPTGIARFRYPIAAADRKANITPYTQDRRKRNPPSNTPSPTTTPVGSPSTTPLGSPTTTLTGTPIVSAPKP
ncbi:uncharacterized protein LY89DRAFT_734841 [Mollisia scopiformis]|uniref:Uncharacterized protein n=1 Tax=Mollisia scopiformis TaxID=149040 RepID=A0A194X792_MOLSC|nr:uncharacterized protein LY89DRAFT_734841 [Mollisia scopiformis]KUJ15687.1 hypothetical protein LY89DRAFT_734841 [Mollisia scopiformis]